MKQVDSNWHSKIEAYRMCPRKYRYLYVDGIQEPGKMSSDLAFGIALHAALESLLRGENGYEAFDTMWEFYNLKGLVYNRFNFTYLSDVGEGFIRKFKKFYLKHIEPVEIEQRLFGRLGNISYEGTPDVIAKYKGKLSVIDWKTTAYKYDKEKIVVAEQLINYANLARQKGLEIKQVVYFPFVKTTGSIQTPLVQQVDEKVLDTTAQHTVEWVDLMRADTKLPKTSSSCIRGPMKCSFFERCWK